MCNDDHPEKQSMSPKESQRRRVTSRKRREIEKTSRQVIPGLIALAIVIAAFAAFLALFLPWVEARFNH
jgi:hypothetical protein